MTEFMLVLTSTASEAKGMKRVVLDGLMYEVTTEVSRRGDGALYVFTKLQPLGAAPSGR